MTLRPVAWAGIGCAAGFTVLTAVVQRTDPAVDLWLHQWVVAHRGLTDVQVARVLTDGGASIVAWPTIALAAALFSRRGGLHRLRTTLAVAAGAAAGIGVRLVVCTAVHRARPPAADWADVPGGFAFPSGHTTTATLAAGLLAWSVSRRLRSPEPWALRAVWAVWTVRAVWTVAVVWAVVVGVTRVWLGVHWPLDVVGGWLFGAGWIAGMAVVADLAERRLGGLPAAPSGGQPPGDRGIQRDGSALLPPVD